MHQDTITATQRRAARAAVIELAARRGLSNVTVADVAAAAGLDAARLAEATEGRLTPLVLEAYDEVLADLLDRCVRAYGAGPWGDGVRRGITAVFEAAMADPEAARFAYIEVPAGERDVLAARARKRAGWAESFIARCAATPEERPSQMQIELFFGAVRQTVEGHLRRGSLDDLLSSVEPLVATFEPPGQRQAVLPSKLAFVPLSRSTSTR